jgi:hypothetical protein
MIIRITIFLLFISTVASAQSSEDAGIFKKSLEEELAKRKNGEWLYQRSEVYRKSVLHNVAEKLHLGTSFKTKDQPVSPQNLPGVFSQDISNDQFGQEETTVAISRNDPNLIVIGSNDEPEDVRSMPIFLSTDGGKSWNTSRMPIPPKPYYAYGDPFLAADQFGGFYYAFLIYNDKLSMSNIMVAHSVDGVTWTYGEPVIFGKGQSASSEDKESIAVDSGSVSPTNGRVYVSWMHFDADTSKQGLQLAWSDNLAQSWSEPVRIDNGSGFFSQVKVDKDGNVFYTYSEYVGDGTDGTHYLLISYDHGATFIRRKIGNYYNYPYSDREHIPTLKGASGFQAFPYITMDYDSHLNTLHVVYGSYKKWNDTTYSAILYYVKTSNGGITWSNPFPIGFQGDSTTLHTDRFMPWIGINQETDDVHILYYSSEDDPKNIKTEAYRAIIHTGGPVSYTRISDSLFNPLQVTDYNTIPFIGDYIGCGIRGSTDVYTWTENRKGYSDGEIYAYVINPSAGISGIHQVSANALNIVSVYPNPAANDKFNLDIAIPQSGRVTLSLLSISGAFSKKLFQEDLPSGTYEKELDIHGIANGEYIISLENGSAAVQKKIIITH